MWPRTVGQTSPSSVAIGKGAQGQVITGDTMTVSHVRSDYTTFALSVHAVSAWIMPERFSYST